MAAGVVGVLLVIPLANVLFQAFRKGPGAYAGALAEADTVHAIFLTLVVSLLSVALNTVFGVAAAWAIGKYSFRGKALLVTLIDLPFAVSPVVSGLVFVLIFGLQSALGRWLDAQDIRVLGAFPGIVIATLFVTFPFVAREVLPVMEAVGTDPEEAALTLGASPWQTFWHVTLPGVKWGVLYGILLCTARAVGEFGAVSVVSGRIAGKTDTMSLRVEKLYLEYQSQAAFAVATLFLGLAVATLVVKSVVEGRLRRALAEAAEKPGPA
jgi:sulfate transport system permease protein